MKATTTEKQRAEDRELRYINVIKANEAVIMNIQHQSREHFSVILYFQMLYSWSSIEVGLKQRTPPSSLVLAPCS